ncbi:hypothetical protein FHS75_002006 [Novosphingobium marinum]|uniref:Uncharacterized protein n=1 Tax=Novosphingobium marinum TaxID=1514948 RepID=A0A7Z0BVZ0_9SPHN|nr:hypothetical protein [Novosphingobium marinum]
MRNLATPSIIPISGAFMREAIQSIVLILHPAGDALSRPQTEEA